MKAFEALAANPSSKLVVVPMESAALAGGVVQALELLRPSGGTRPPAPPARPSRGRTVEPGLIWILGGLLLLIAELGLPGIFLLWVGLAAIGTGIVVLIALPPFPAVWRSSSACWRPASPWRCG